MKNINIYKILRFGNKTRTDNTLYITKFVIKKRKGTPFEIEKRMRNLTLKTCYLITSRPRARQTANRVKGHTNIVHI